MSITTAMITGMGMIITIMITIIITMIPGSAHSPAGCC